MQPTLKYKNMWSVFSSQWCSGRQSPKAFLCVVCLWLIGGEALCLAAAPDLFRCAFVVGRVLEGRAVSERRALVPGRAVLHLPVWMVAIVPGGFVVRVVGAVLRVEAVLRVSPVLGVAFWSVLPAGAVLVQLPVLALTVVSEKNKSGQLEYIQVWHKTTWNS